MKIDFNRRRLNHLIGLGVLSVFTNVACRASPTGAPQAPTLAIEGPTFLYFYTDN